MGAHDTAAQILTALGVLSLPSFTLALNLFLYVRNVSGEKYVLFFFCLESFVCSSFEHTSLFLLVAVSFCMFDRNVCVARGNKPED